MELMHHEDSCSDEEAEGHARLMALAAQVATQRGPSQPISQAVRSCHPGTSALSFSRHSFHQGRITRGQPGDIWDVLSGSPPVLLLCILQSFHHVGPHVGPSLAYQGSNILAGSSWRDR